MNSEMIEKYKSLLNSLYNNLGQLESIVDVYSSLELNQIDEKIVESMSALNNELAKVGEKFGPSA